jgi:hypothetical protein
MKKFLNDMLGIFNEMLEEFKRESIEFDEFKEECLNLKEKLDLMRVPKDNRFLLLPLSYKKKFNIQELFGFEISYGNYLFNYLNYSNDIQNDVLKKCHIYCFHKESEEENKN